MDELDEMEDFLLNLKNSVFCVKNGIKKKLLGALDVAKVQKAVFSARLSKLPYRAECILIVYQESKVKKKTCKLWLQDCSQVIMN